jgi:putative FmdB family regulatory protein
MPFYEYQCVDLSSSCQKCQDVFEFYQSITSEAITKCPDCNNDIQRKISIISGFIDKNRQMNQYNDVKYAKYWRDKNGNRHAVTQADGSISSPTVSSRITASPQEIKRKQQIDAAKSKHKRVEDSYKRFLKQIKK